MDPDVAGRTDSEAPPPSLRASLAVLLPYAALVAFGLWHHEVWRDEVQAWLLVRDTSSLGELFSHLRYEGHPALWYLVLLPLARLFDGPAAMQVLHGLLAVAAAGLLVRYGPFSLAQKAFILAGYFFAYEYAVVSRSYVLGVLLLFGFLVALTRGGRRAPVAATILLALLAHTSAYGVILAVAGAAALVVQAWAGEGFPLSKKEAVVASLVVAAAAAVSAAQIVPPADAAFDGRAIVDRDVTAQWGAASTAAWGWKALLPVSPVLQGHPWEAQLLLGGSTVGLAAAAGLTLLLLLLLAFFVAPSRGALTLLVLASGAMFLSTYFVHYGRDLRHSGHLVLLGVAAVWWRKSWSGGCQRLLGTPPLRPLHHASRAALALALVGQAIGTVQAYANDVAKPFSNARAVAEAIERTDGGEAVVVAERRPTGSSVAVHLDRPIFYLDRGAFGTFTAWKERASRVRITGTALAAIPSARASGPDRVLLVAERPLEGPLGEWSVGSVTTFPPAIVGSERFVLYDLRRGVH